MMVHGNRRRSRDNKGNSMLNSGSEADNQAWQISRGSRFEVLREELVMESNFDKDVAHVAKGAGTIK